MISKKYYICAMNTVWIVMPILIVLMFLLGTDLKVKSFVDVARNPKAVVAGMVGQIIVLPLLAFGVGWALGLSPVYFMGLVLIACCPGGSSSNVFSMLARGDVALSVTLTAISSVIVRDPDRDKQRDNPVHPASDNGPCFRLRLAAVRGGGPSSRG